MARIRSIKPEFWSSEQVMECSPIARLLFIGLWNFADDKGRHPASGKQIKALVFPGDDISSSNVRDLLAELDANGLIRIYIVDGKEFFEITGWHHQKIDRPQDPKYPPPPGDSQDLGESHSSNDRRALATDRIGSLGGDRIGEDLAAAPQQPRAPAPDGLLDFLPPSPASDRFDRILEACGDALGDQAPADPVIGPIILLLNRGIRLADVLTVLRSEAQRTRLKPIRTWKLWAEKIVEALDAAPKVAAKPPVVENPDDPLVKLTDEVTWPESLCRKIISRYELYSDAWPQGIGPEPGQPGCRMPERLLPERFRTPEEVRL